MKKFLVFLLVLGLTTATQATVAGLIFTVNGQPQPAEITLAPSQTIELDLELQAGHNTAGYTLEWEILGGRAELIWSGVEFPLVFQMASRVMTNPAPLPNKVRMTGGQLSGVADGPGVIMKGLILHCLTLDPQGDPTIMNVTVRATTKVDGQTIANGTVVHTLTIHQIPEPATLMLLGLGSLFLLRRKK